MGALKNLRHESFAQQLVMAQKFGWTQGAAYSRAGYSAEGMAAEAAASRLLKDVKNGIAGRVQEIVGAGAKRARVTVQDLLADLDRVMSRAETAEQFSAAQQAIVSKAKLLGLMKEKLEISSGDFSQCETPGQVVDKLLQDLSDLGDPLAALDELREQLVQRLADQARDITPAPAKPKVGDEVGAALATLRHAPGGRRR